MSVREGGHAQPGAAAATHAADALSYGNALRFILLLGAVSLFADMTYEGARRYFIWGATAAMLRNLYQLMRA